MAAGGDEIEAFDFEQAMQWLDDRGIDYSALESLDEMNDLIRVSKQQDIKAGVKDEVAVKPPLEQSQCVAQQLMQEILRQDKAMKRELLSVYDDLSAFLATKVDDGIKAVLGHYYGDFEAALVTYKKELADGDCAILVAGETSAGKSSLLNLILGEEVLPVALLSATSTICRLRNSERKAFTLVTDDGKEEYVDIETEKEVEKLKECVGSSAGCQYRHVDIYWPIPMLQDCVTIVDTPGVGESEDVTERLMEYLPKAVAFIYVINSSIAGGIQDDKLLRVIRTQQRLANDRNLAQLDTRSLIFVCNKWDCVLECNQEEAVWSKTLGKLREVLPDVSDEQVLKMSVADAKRYWNSGLGFTEQFQNLLRGIERMVPGSLRAKISRHYRWLESFMKKLQGIIVARIHHAQSTTAEQRVLYETVSERLKGLQRNSEKVREKLTKVARTMCQELAVKLHKHLNSEEVLSRLTDWRDDEAPEADNDDLYVTKVLAEKLIMKKIQEELRVWENDKANVQELADSLTSLFTQECNVLGKLCDEVDLIIEGIDGSGDLEAAIENIIRVSNRLDTDEAPSYSAPHLDPNCLQRSLRHENIVNFFGYSISFPGGENKHHAEDEVKVGVTKPEWGVTRLERGVTKSGEGDNVGTVSLVFELCEENLEEKIFRKQELQCSCYDSSDEQNSAFRLFVTMATGVCAGLSYIHENGFIHRDLKLSNVLIKDGKAKICDLGVTRREIEVTGTFTGTLTHMSPELLSNRLYTSATDIFSLAILLWELWHGRHVYSEPEHSGASLTEMIDRVKSGRRPSLKYEYQMPRELQELVRKCWHRDPAQRPKAADVGNKLKTLYLVQW